MNQNSGMDFTPFPSSILDEIRTHNLKIKLGRIHSNSYEFRHFEFQKSNSDVEFGRIRIFGSNSNEFDIEFCKNMVFEVKNMFF